MRKFKFLLPLLAFVMAIGMSFAFVSTTGEDFYVTKYIMVPGGWATINVVCAPEDHECSVTFENDPLQTEYRVYDSKNPADPAEGSGIAVELDGSVPNPDSQL